MLHVIPVVATKKIGIEYTQKEMRKILKHYSIKDQLIIKKTVMQKMRVKKAIKYIENK